MKVSLRLGILTAALTALACITGAAARADQLRLGNEGTYPPFSMITADGTLTGFEPELARAMCQRMKADCKIEAMDFKALLPSLISGKIDLIASQLWPTPEQISKTEFSTPVLYNPNAFIVPKSWNKDFTDADFRGVKVEVMRGSSQAEYLKSKFSDATLVYYDNPDQMQLDLLAGRAEAAFGAKLNWTINLISKPDGANWKASGEFWDTGKPVGLSWAAQKGNKALIERVNAAIGAMLQDCTYTNIRKRFIPIPATPEEPKQCL